MDKEELYKTLLNSPTHKYSLLNEIYAIRDTRVETENYTIAVNGFISVNSLINDYNLINEKQQLISWLEDKIKEYEVVPADINELDYNCLVGKYIAFQEVLDFVNKGGKE